ncbi:hypothetical protein BCR44DRAFT_55445 [Catenaria anguillulae PL171]|uniref:Sacsin/Nov domain-containing protein n=1 Tax=Catenaria anguillulae PL171 TaxID=765915 RepID=A0A1Y2HP67_9FUNG|nr:hypothetical protein BCR44DRAFT_55445 [Catenaria anguillulae PL171]
MADHSDAQLQARNLLLQHGVEERVETNTRHLIDKILARYSAEFTIFRELIQNSNDAGATHVKIEFTCAAAQAASTAATSDSHPTPAAGALPTMSTAITYKNNGRVFQDQDWRRLKSIAEGNPDETKVGFFGVGFYSLFSVCEEPFVRSGDKCLGFFWKGDQLFAKRAELPPTEQPTEVEERKWTVFDMQLREPMLIPRVNDFSKFLATCLSFTETLTHIDMYLNLGPTGESKHVISLAKTLSPDLPLSLPPNTRRSSPQSLFTLDHIDLRNVQMTAKLLQEVEEKEEQSLTSKVALWFGVAKPKPPKPKEYKWVQCSIFLRVARATVLVKSSAQLQAQMERTTKKRVPGKVTMSAVYNTADEYKLSQELAVESRVFEDLVPYPRQGNIFIGFRTHQTTGCSVHLASHFIPTVERENMDFVDPTLAYWNQELTSMGGTLCRVLFDTELAESRADPDRYTHVVNSFTCHPSTPASTVSQLVSRAFFLASTDELVVLSTKGLKPVSQVRMYDSAVAAFLLDDLPMLAKPVYDAAKPFFDLLLDARLLKPVTVADVFQALPPTIDDHARLACIWSWAIANRSSLAHHHLITLKSRTPFTRFASSRWFPPAAPMPEDVMPNTLAKQVEEHQLRWLGYSEIGLVDWAQYVADKGLLTTLPDGEPDTLSAGTKVVELLGILARAHPNLPATQSALILSLLTSLKCMPTATHGLVAPGDAYLPATSAAGSSSGSGGVFSASDLPMLTSAAAKLPHAFLRALGVRDHIDPHLILSRLDSLNWSPAQLVAYFARESRLDEVDVAKIAGARVFEGKCAGKVVEGRKYVASELVMPHLELDGLDVVQVHGLPESMVRQGCKEWRFLVRIGVKRGVDARWVVEQASKKQLDADKRVALIMFALGKGEVGRMSERQVAYLPTTSAGELATSDQVFTDSACAVMGFKVLDPRLETVADKLGVAKHPPVDKVLAQLAAKPLTDDTAKPVLEYLALRAPELGQRALTSLSTLAFVPTSGGPRAPKDVYLKPFPLLPHVDFGDTANQFLRLCGVKDEPTPVEMAEWLLAHGAASVYADRPAEYLDVLTKVAFNLSTIPAHVLRRLANAPVLVGFQGSKQMLVAAPDVYLVDDPVLQTIFAPVTCPMDPTLEAFYEHLGARWLGSVIDRRYDVAWAPGRGQAGDPATPRAKGLQVKIKERAPLLVHDLNASKNIQSNALAQLQGVQVQEVTRIDLVREFMGKKHVQGVSAAMASKSVLLVAAVAASGDDAGVAEMDYFDVARCLSGLIFKRPKLNDQLLLSTLLSTGLDALRMKGFPVDRILKITPKLAEAAQKQKVVPPAPKTSPAHVPIPPPAAASPSPTPPPKSTQAAGLPPPSSSKSSETLPPPSYEDATGGLPGALKRNPGSEAGLNGNTTPPTPSRQSLFEKVKSSSPRGSLMNLVNNALGAASSSSSSSSSSQYPGSASTPPPPSHHQPPQQQHSSSSSAIQPSTGQPSQPPPGTRMLREGTPEFDAQLQSTLQSAIRASSSAAAPGTVVANPPQLAQAQQTYCDLVSAGHDLVEVSQGFLPMKLYRGRSHSDADVTTGAMRARFIEFAGIIMLLADVFGLPARALHVYVDEQAQSVAFNRGRALFFNASRYMPAAGSSKAYTYWFMVFAHELAHNHVAAHNADHEFYMASYASVYMTKLMVVLLGLGIDLATPE